VSLIAILLNIYSYDKIVALSPAINEIIYALKADDKIVGNTTFCTYPAKSQSKPKVGGYFYPSLEKIVSLKPDLVLMQHTDKKLIKIFPS